MVRPQPMTAGTCLRRFNRVMLWVEAAVVLALALFPIHVGLVLRGDGGPRIEAPVPRECRESRRLRIEGMTCEACSVALRGQLAGVPGVARAEVSFEARTARVYFDADRTAPSGEALLEAVRQTGCSGALLDASEP